MPTTYAVASAKGGVGKTTTAANLAATLAAAGFETVAVDGDVGTANLAPALGVEVPEDGATLHDVLAGEASPEDATYAGPHGLSVVPGDQSLSAFRSADPSRIREVLGSITNADYVVVDTGAGLTHESALPLSLADEVLLVSTPTRDALVDTGKTLQLTERLGGEVAGLTLTRVGPDDGLASALAAADIDPDEFDVPVLGRIPEDPAVAEAVAAREPLTEYAPGSDAAAAYRSLASSLTGEPIRPPLSYEVEEGEQEPTKPDETEAESVEPEADAGEDEVEADEGEGDEIEAGEDEAAEAEVDEGEAAGAEIDEAEATAVDADDAGDDEADANEPETADAEEDDVDEDGEVEVTEAEPTTDVGELPDEDDVDESTSDGDAEEREATGEEEADKTGGTETDDAVIIENETPDEEGAAAAARRTVPGDDEFEDDGPVTVEDAESGESAEIGDDVIPFAEQNRERSEQAKQGQEGDDDDVDEDDNGKRGGILGRLFR
ncbi:P-loop NTPase [Halorarum halophilum]|uniref:P-loop NTPase n=1 Tax=Halorarum halophilum TaxID=2743090 RepID=A0A7D5GDV1_9EURY|nr:P-loop NTPase [Halobaculum halophilum]QLG29346.1 P-loop NTPase [Halobaculum halophilum]